MGFPSISIRYRVSVSLSIRSDRDSPSSKWIFLLLPFGAFMRVKGAVAPPVTVGGFADSGFLAYMSLTIVITVFKSC